MLYGMLNRSAVSFNPDKDIPSLDGKVILITGGNVGLGKESILRLSKHNPSRIYLAARTESKALSAIKDIQALVPSAPITYIHCDLTSLPSVQACAREFVAKESRLDILMLNAGIMAVPAGTTEQGYEIQFGTNHIGHALLAKLLLPTLLKTAKLPGADVRVITLASIGHVMARGVPFGELKSDMKGHLTWERYGNSKLANILFVRELAGRYKSEGITAVAIHPGIVDTDLYKSAFSGIMGWMDKAKGWVYTNVEGGAKNQLWAATTKLGEKNGEVQSGEYYTPVGVAGQGTSISGDMLLAGKLWEWTEQELKGYEL